MVAPVFHPLSVCPVLELPDSVLLLLAIPAARRDLANPSVHFLHSEREKGVGRDIQMKILAGGPERGCAAALCFHLCLSSLPLSP